MCPVVVYTAPARPGFEKYRVPGVAVLGTGGLFLAAGLYTGGVCGTCATTWAAGVSLYLVLAGVVMTVVGACLIAAAGFG